MAMAVAVAGVMPSPTTGLGHGGTLSNALGSSFLSPPSRSSLAVAASGKGGRLSLATQQQRSPLVVSNVVSTEKRDGGFAAISDDDYAENFRPPHITDNFDIPARPSTFCAKTR